MRKDYDNELRSTMRLLGFAACIAMLGVFVLALRGCNLSRDYSQRTANAPLSGAFEKFAGRVLLVEFSVSASGADTEDSVLFSRWAAQDVLSGLKYARVSTDTAVKPESGNIALMSDPAGKLAASCRVRSRPWYTLIDKNGRVRYTGSSLQAEIMDQWVLALQAEYVGKTDPVAMFGVEPDGTLLRESTVLKSLANDENIRLSSLVGRAGTVFVVVDTVCPYSEQAITEFPEISPLLYDMGFETAIVNIGDSMQAVQDYYSTRANRLNILYDTGSMTRLSWDIQTVPTVVVLDSKGKIHYSSSALWQDVINAAATASRSSVEYELKVRGTGYG